MKKFFIIAWSVFILGLFFKLFMFPGSGELLFFGCLSICIHSIIFLVKNARKDIALSFLYLSAALWTIYLLIKVKFWAGGPIILGFSTIFIIAFLVTLVWFILQIAKRSKFKLPQYALLVYFVFSIILSYTHSYHVFYFFNLNTVIHNESRNQDFTSWDKYSWFLFIADKEEEALAANNEAQKALDEYLKTSKSYASENYTNLIKQHREQISNKSWTTYPY